MTTVFNRIHRLKRQPGWTWDHFLSQIDLRFPGGLDEKTLYSHYRQPHKKPSSHVTRIINQLHEIYFPDPFPEEINRLMRLYNNLYNCKKHLNLDRDIEDLEFFLNEQLRREDKAELLHIARLHWLIGNIQFDRIALYRDNGQRQLLNNAKHAAIQHYQQSVSALEQHNQLSSTEEAVGAIHLYKARHNILACHLNAVPQEQRSHDEEILRYLRESNYIANSKQTLAVEPFQWSIARNGLRFSSLLENREDIEHFFKALVQVSDSFLDLEYKPLNTGAIMAGSEFEWAIHNVLTLEFRATLREQ